MNRYTVQGLVADAVAGKTVVVASCRPAQRHAALEEILVAAAGETIRVIRVIRSNGREQVDFATGGSIRFAGAHSLRGAVADVVYLADRADGTIPDVTQAALAVIATSSCGEVIRVD